MLRTLALSLAERAAFTERITLRHSVFTAPVRHELLCRFVAAALALVVSLALAVPGSPPAQAAEPEPVKVGVLKYGTVNWELDVIQHHGLAEKQGVDLEVVELASKNAAAVALQGDAVDIIVTDWIWVSRQRAAGLDYTFVPHSLIAGGLVIRPDAGIEELADLEGKRIGVAGGPVDKSWLLLRAYSRQTLGEDLAKSVEPVYGAPPLLNELVLKGELPAALTFWHYQARLEAAGMEELVTIAEMLPALGVDKRMPVIGWVFSEEWAKNNRDAVQGFLAASREAKEILATSDEEWERLRTMIQPKDEATLVALRNAYREGIPSGFGEKDIAAARKAFAILAELGGTELVGRSRKLAAGTFWTAAEY